MTVTTLRQLTIVILGFYATVALAGHYEAGEGEDHASATW